MLRRRGESIGALGYHAGDGDFGTDFLSGQMAADTGLGPLADFNFHDAGDIKVFRVNAEAPRCHLNGGIISILIKAGVQPALAGIPQRAHLGGRPGQRLVHIEAYRTVRHGGKHHRDFQLDLRGKFRFQIQV